MADDAAGPCEVDIAVYYDADSSPEIGLCVQLDQAPASRSAMPTLSGAAAVGVGRTRRTEDEPPRATTQCYGFRESQ
jgi:hypothetical protein